MSFDKCIQIKISTSPAPLRVPHSEESPVGIACVTIIFVSLLHLAPGTGLYEGRFSHIGLSSLYKGTPHTFSLVKGVSGCPGCGLGRAPLSL